MQKHPAPKPARGVPLPIPVIILIAVAILVGLFFASKAKVTRKHKEANKTEIVTTLKQEGQTAQKAKTDEVVTYAEFDTGRRTKTESRVTDRNTRTVTKKKTTHYTESGQTDIVVEEETAIDDLAKDEARSEDKGEISRETKAVTHVTSTTDTTVKTVKTDQTKASDSSETEDESKMGSTYSGRAGLAITSGGNLAVTWDLARVRKWSAQTIIEIDSGDASLRGAGIGVSKDLVKDGRFFIGSHSTYGKRDGVKVGAHVGVRF